MFLAYGEDGLTLWALTNQLDRVLQALGEKQAPKAILFRPSFGRGSKSCFGEFDFILLGKQVWLGVSKWDGVPPKVENQRLVLGPAQLERHKVFAEYLDVWTFGRSQAAVNAGATAWEAFRRERRNWLAKTGKSIPNTTTSVARSIQAVSRLIRRAYGERHPAVRNVLLYFHAGRAATEIPAAPEDFAHVLLDYRSIMLDHTSGLLRLPDEFCPPCG